MVSILPHLMRYAVRPRPNSGSLACWACVIAKRIAFRVALSPKPCASVRSTEAAKSQPQASYPSLLPPRYPPPSKPSPPVAATWLPGGISRLLEAVGVRRRRSIAKWATEIGTCPKLESRYVDRASREAKSCGFQLIGIQHSVCAEIDDFSTTRFGKIADFPPPSSLRTEREPLRNPSRPLAQT